MAQLTGLGGGPLVLVALGSQLVADLHETLVLLRQTRHAALRGCQLALQLSDTCPSTNSFAVLNAHSNKDVCYVLTGLGACEHEISQNSHSRSLHPVDIAAPMPIYHCWWPSRCTGYNPQLSSILLNSLLKAVSGCCLFAFVLPY